MTSRVIVSIRVEATPDRAFAVFTQDIARWWQASGLFQLTPRGDGALSFEGGAGGQLVCRLDGDEVFEVGRIRAWEPPHRLVVGWRQAGFPPDRDTELEVRFDLVGQQTRVTVEHSGWDTIPQAHAVRHGFPEGPFLQRTAEHWRDLLASYRDAAATAR